MCGRLLPTPEIGFAPNSRGPRLPERGAPRAAHDGRDRSPAPAFAGLGLRKVRFSGGEPTIWADIREAVGRSFGLRLVAVVSGWRPVLSAASKGLGVPKSPRQELLGIQHIVENTSESLIEMVETP